MVRHAIASEDKQARREAILDAANALFVSGDGTLPAAAEIAMAAGLAKGTVYLYFQTKEEIFIALLLNGIDALLSDLESAFQGTKGRRAEKVTAFLKVYVDQLHLHPELLRLDALGYGVLEKNLDPVKLREFKFAFVSRLTETGAIIDKGFRLSPGRGSILLMRTFALTRGLWQSSHPFEEAPAMKGESALAIIFPDFRTELMEALTEYWRGALAAP